jgi:integrase
VRANVLRAGIRSTYPGSYDRVRWIARLKGGECLSKTRFRAGYESVPALLLTSKALRENLGRRRSARRGSDRSPPGPGHAHTGSLSTIHANTAEQALTGLSPVTAAAPDFAARFLEGYAKANRLKPSGIAAKKTILRVHLYPPLGDKQLDTIQTEDVQRLRSALHHRSPKTVNNVLTVLGVLLRTARDWDVIDRIPCVIKLLPTTKGAASFYDFGEYARLVEAARSDLHAYLIALFGGEAGLRCGGMMALEWTDVDFNTRQLCVARSDWKGHVTVPKGGRIRYVPLTKRLTEALRQARHCAGRASCPTRAGRRSRRR